MRLIANRPCSFGGRKFYIGDVVPGDLVADARLQEKMGVVTIVNDGMGASGRQPGTLYTQEQVEEMVAEAVEEAEKKRADELAVLQGYAAELQEEAPGANEGSIQIPVKCTSDGEDGQYMAILAAPGEIQQVFSILQMNADEGAKAIADVASEDVLILLHASDSRKTVKNAAKERADYISSIQSGMNESIGGNATTGTNAEGG